MSDRSICIRSRIRNTTFVKELGPTVWAEAFGGYELFSALWAEVRCVFPGGTFHTFVDIGVVHHIGYPFAAFLTVVEGGTPLGIPGDVQLLFRCGSTNGLRGTYKSVGQITEKLITVSVGMCYDLVSCSGPFFHCGISSFRVKVFGFPPQVIGADLTRVSGNGIM